MAITVKTIPYIAIAALLLYVFYLRECTRPITVTEEIQTFDTSAFMESLEIVYPDTVYEPTTVYIYKDSLIYIEVPEDVDSLDIVNKYFQGWVVIDTVVNNTNVFLVLKDKGSQNRITERSIIDFIVYPKYKLVTETIIEKPKLTNKFYIGMGIGGGIDSFGLTANALLVTKRDNAYGLSYDIIQKHIYVTVYFKLSLGLFNKNN